MSIIHDLVESLPNQALVSVTDGALDATWGGHACSPEIEETCSSAFSKVVVFAGCAIGVALQ